MYKRKIFTVTFIFGWKEIHNISFIFIRITLHLQIEHILIDLLDASNENSNLNALFSFIWIVTDNHCMSVDGINIACLPVMRDDYAITDEIQSCLIVIVF